MINGLFSIQIIAVFSFKALFETFFRAVLGFPLVWLCEKSYEYNLTSMHALWRLLGGLLNVLYHPRVPLAE